MGYQQMYSERTTHMGKSDEIIFCKIQKKRKLYECAIWHKREHGLRKQSHKRAPRLLLKNSCSLQMYDLFR